MTNRATQLQAFDRLLTIMDELREQCPWDQKQTMETLRPLTIEETYELGDAILDADLKEVKGELGDLVQDDKTHILEAFQARKSHSFRHYRASTPHV